MLPGLDLIPLVIAARMNRDTVDSIEDMNFAGAGDQGQDFPYMGMRNGVVIQVEPDLRRFP